MSDHDRSAVRVEVRGLTKRFGNAEVLKGVDLAARTGEVVSILGASGSGKSTMLRCINFLEVPTSGHVSVCGETVSVESGGAGPTKEQRQVIMRIRMKAAMVFQSFNLWTHRTVFENVVEVPIHVHKRNKAEARDEAMHWLERVGLAEKAGEYPAFLSGGQQQRAAIARALAVRPEVLLFDEPTSSLDPELVGEVLDVVRSLAAEHRTMLIVTHEMGFARDVSSSVVFLHNGLVEEMAPPDQIFANPKSAHFARFISRMSHR